MQKEHLVQENALDATQLQGVTRLEGKVSLEIGGTGQDAANRLKALPPPISSHKDCRRSSSRTLKVGEKATDRCLPAGGPLLQHQHAAGQTTSKSKGLKLFAPFHSQPT